MGSRFRNAVLGVLLLAFAAPAQALDPMVMFLFSVAREVITAAARAQKAAPSLPVPEPSTRYPGTSVEPADMRRVIDECFSYLSGAQRTEIFEALHAQLMDPRNAAVRTSTIEYFVARAVAVREAKQRLAGLSASDRDRLVTEFKAAVSAMPPEDAEQLAGLLRQGILPVPDELGAQLLAAIDAR
jgi:hypothetical protein